MKLNYQTIALVSLALVMTTISCSKSSGDGSSQPAENPQPAGEIAPFVGSWNDSPGNILTISKPNQSTFSGYNYEVKYSAPSDFSFDEPCQLTNPTTLLCGRRGDSTFVYNLKDSTITATTTIPDTTTTIFYKPGKAPNDPASDFLHTFRNETAYVTITHGLFYDIKCEYDNHGYIEHRIENLSVSILSDNKKEVKGSDKYGLNFEAIYDVKRRTLTMSSNSLTNPLCYMPDGTILSLSE